MYSISPGRACSLNAEVHRPHAHAAASRVQETGPALPWPWPGLSARVCHALRAWHTGHVRTHGTVLHACMQDAARVMGNTALFSLMQEASAAIKRDVIFAASLYVA